ncbi:unnamed protein product [Discula destructiva]
MQLLLPFALLPLLLITSPSLAFAADHSRLRIPPHPHPGHARSNPSFVTASTWLRDSAAWLRDGAVRVFSGGPSTHHVDKPSSNTNADVYHMYHDDIVVRFNVTTVEEDLALAKSAHRESVDVWAWDQTVDLRIPKHRLQPLLHLLPKPLRERYSIMIEDFPSAILESSPSAEHRREKNQKEDMSNAEQSNTHGLSDGDEGRYFFRNYQPHTVVVRWMRLIEAMFPSSVRFTSIGKSYEGRDIPALMVKGDSSSRDPSKPRKTMVVMGGSHAREWISTTTVNYLAWAMITSYGKDRLITKFMQEYDIVFIPEMNPDGIEYTWNADRLWRKSRQPTDVSPWCLGLDLDHAFGYEWDTWRSGLSNDPCSESYAGQEPWESVEVSAFRDWAKNEAQTNNVDFVGLIDLHSYSQQILFPYSYTCHIEPPNLEKMEELALGLAKSIRLFSGEAYSVKPACRGAMAETTHSSGDSLQIEPSGGSAIDWFYHELGAHYSYQIKLRDTGSYGFLLPPDQIIPTGEEILHAFKYLGDFLLGNDGIENMRADDAAETTEEAYVVPEESEPVLELRRRMKR